MCLSSVTEQMKKPTRLVQDGWKEFGTKGDQLAFVHQPFQGKREVPRDQWITAEATVEITADRGQKYLPLFHVYEDEEQAKKAGARVRVFVRGIVCRGLQGDKRVVIAREMYVPSDPEGWPPPDAITPSQGNA